MKGMAYFAAVIFSEMYDKIHSAMERSRMAFVMIGLLILGACSTKSQSASTQKPRSQQVQTPAVQKSAVATTQIEEMTAEKFYERIKQGDVVVIDVRTPREYAEGHIPGAVNIDFYAPDFESKIAALDKDKEYLVHCRSGNRSRRSLPIFQKHGFKKIGHLTRGINEWYQKGLPIEKGSQ